MDQILDSWKDSIRQRGYRITRPRQQVMEIITNSRTALTPQEIYHQSLDLEQPPGIASVYRTLEMLDELGLIQQIHQPDGCHGIWPALEGHKHLLLCTNCNDMQVIEGNEEISDYINMIEEQTSYQVRDHWLQLFGLCTGCLE
jgi:Fe2+ or Zn2+ uptake regulation protein